jgi:hypothetical protein
MLRDHVRPRSLSDIIESGRHTQHALLNRGHPRSVVEAIPRPAWDRQTKGNVVR